MCYVEISFRKPEELPTSTDKVGVLWAPDLFCKDKPYFNDANFCGALELMLTMVACEMHAPRDGDGEFIVTPGLIPEVRQALKDDVVGVVALDVQVLSVRPPS